MDNVKMRFFSRLVVAASPVALAQTAACQVVAGLDEPLVEGRSGDAGAPREGGAGAPLDEYAAAVLADKPVLYVRFSETSGVRAADASGNAADVTLGGEVARGRPGLVRGGDPSVEIKTSGQLVLDEKYDYPLDRAFSYEVWIRPNRLGEIISNRVNAPQLLGTGLDLAPEFPFIRFERWGGAQGGEQRLSAHWESRAPVQLGTVFHLVAVSNGTEPPILYVNGARYPGYLKAGGALPAPTALVVGSEVKGDFDELAIYDKALPAERVLAHYALGNN